MSANVDGWGDSTDDRRGVLVVGHGTRDAAGLAEFDEVVRAVGARLAPVPVEAGFLELAEPTIAAGIERLVERGVRRLTEAPVVLFAAGHAKRDIPEAVATAPAVVRLSLPWEQAAPLGLHPQLLALSQLRYDEAVAALPPVAAEQTLLVVVGRGSTDPEAAAATREFARLRAVASGVGRTATAFAAVCEPSLDAVLREAAGDASLRRVVVQPHLLFAGAVRRLILERMAAVGAHSPSVDASPHAGEALEWIATEHLGPHPLLVDALCDRLEQTTTWRRP